MQFGNAMRGGTKPRGGGKEGGGRKKSDGGQEEREEEKGGGRGRLWSSDASALYPFVF